MKRWIKISVPALLFVSMLFGATTYYNYYQDEQEIAEVISFRETALQAFQALGYDKIDTALTLYEQALQIHAEDAKTMADYALALKKAGRIGEAADSYLKSYILDKTQHEENLANAALLYFHQHRYGQAMAIYETLLKEHKPLFRYIDKIAFCALKTGDEEKIAQLGVMFDKAKEDLRTARMKAGTHGEKLKAAMASSTNR